MKPQNIIRLGLIIAIPSLLLMFALTAYAAGLVSTGNPGAPIPPDARALGQIVCDVASAFGVAGVAGLAMIGIGLISAAMRGGTEVTTRVGKLTE